MDLLIEKNGNLRRLSSYGLWVQDVIDTSPAISTNFRTLQGRNGRINAGATLISKDISVVGKVTVSGIWEYEELKDEINGLVVNTEPFYITKMLPIEDSLYNYQTPGETQGDLDLLAIPHAEYKYRWQVVTDGVVDWSFKGKFDGGMVFEFKMSFTTSGLPYGETEPSILNVKDSIYYKGTIRNSQLEYPWKMTLTASQGVSGNFDIGLGGRLYEFRRSTSIKVGDVIEIDGISTHLNGENLTQYSNYEHFELNPGVNIIETNFIGEITISPYVEFYM